MQADQFLKKVRERAKLADDEEARRVVHAVFGALRARISHAGGDNVVDQLPKEIRALWERSLLDHVARSLTGVDRMKVAEFLERVRTEAGRADIHDAELVTRAVFQTMGEQVTSGARHAIEAQLPPDIRELWQTSAPATYRSERLGPAVVHVFRSADQMEDEIEELLDASDEVDAHEIDVAVRQGMVTLTGRVKTEHQRDAAARIAREALGVVDVVNQLSVEQ